MKTINIVSCWQCPHFIKVGEVCAHDSFGDKEDDWKPVYEESLLGAGFPEWCPLPDAPEKGE